VRELTGGGVEFSFEAVGSAATAETAFAMLRPGGTCTVVGVLAGSTVRLDGMTLNWERRIQGSLMGSNRFRIDIPRYVELYLQGRLRLDELVSGRIPLDALPGEIGSLHGGAGTRTVVTFE
jgi:S-(hydroxymethyl)glutathione dehydrogenase/alcohol dehydrogenase